MIIILIISQKNASFHIVFIFVFFPKYVILKKCQTTRAIADVSKESIAIIFCYSYDKWYGVT